MWGEQDYQGFLYESNRGTGQVKADHVLSKYIYDLTSDKENKNIVEIGTWNGLGSTRFFIEALLNNPEANFITIENNFEKINFARNYWKNFIEENKLKVEFAHGTLISNEEIDNFIKENSDSFSQQELEWIEVDKANSESVYTIPFEKIDVLLIDGGHFGNLEYDLLKDKCKYILLDDTTCSKSKSTREDLLNREDFEMIFDDTTHRNGVSIFKRK